MSDMFDDNDVATPMSLYTIAVFLGPVLGPWFSGYLSFSWVSPKLRGTFADFWSLCLITPAL
jgi:MFS family permease